MEVRGAQDVDDLVKRLRTHADAKALRKELFAGLNRASKPARAEMIEAIPDALPRSGGLADRVKSKTTSRTTAKSGKWAGVSIRFSSRGGDIRTLTGKRLRHPVFGGRTWVDQTAGVDPTVFPKAFEKQAPEIQRAVLRAMEDVARKVAN